MHGGLSMQVLSEAVQRHPISSPHTMIQIEALIGATFKMFVTCWASLVGTEEKPKSNLPKMSD
jgi:hypothetical protein